jgi:hypothetical protein
VHLCTNEIGVENCFAIESAELAGWGPADAETILTANVRFSILTTAALEN